MAALNGCYNGWRVIARNPEGTAVPQVSAAMPTCIHISVNVHHLQAISEQGFDNSGEPGAQAKGVSHLETVFETRGDTRN